MIGWSKMNERSHDITPKMNERSHDITPNRMLLDVSLSSKKKKYNKHLILVRLTYTKFVK